MKRDFFFFNSKTKKIHYNVHVEAYDGVPWYKWHVKGAITIDFGFFQKKVSNAVVGSIVGLFLFGLVVPPTHILMTGKNIIFNLSFFLISVLFFTWLGYILKNKKKLSVK